ncbi:unnamed protein product, partial [Candidula unifasciata]
MTAAVAVMSASATSMPPKRHGFSIESLIGTSEVAPPSPTTAPPPRTFSIRQFAIRETFKQDRHNEKDTDRIYGEIDRQRDRVREAVKEREVCDHRDRQCSEIERDRQCRDIERDRQCRDIERDRQCSEIERDRQCRDIAREADLFREREMILESLRLRDKELRDMTDRELRDMTDREVSKDREAHQFRDSRNVRHSAAHHQRVSPRSSSPASPRTENSLTPQSENRLGLWAGQEFKHILSSLNSGHFDSSSLYQPLRVCNRTLASMGSLPGVGAPPAALGIGIPPHFSHLQMNPLLYNLPRDLNPQPHPLLAGRFPSFINTRYQ